MKTPNFAFERKIWKQTYRFVAGADEVGRGCFAGPVVAAACVFAPMSNFKLPIFNEKGGVIIINDSKKLTEGQRKRTSDWIMENSLAWGVGIGSAAEINRLGVTKATNSAFRRAINSINKKLESRVDYLLVDAFYIPYIRGLRVGAKNAIKDRRDPGKIINNSRQEAIINGDEKSVSIAAASIIAKVYRDNLMQNLSEKYKIYGWGKNKGYGTLEHRLAIKKYGLTRYHRKQFVATFFNNSYASQAR